jgi:hypothetical protein
MINEKVKVVLVMLAKLCKEVPKGYSKSIDKVRTQILENGSPDVCQFLADELIANTRYLKEVIEDVKKDLD